MVGGGVSSNGGFLTQWVNSLAPEGNGWGAFMDTNDTAASHTFTVQAICASATVTKRTLPTTRASLGEPGKRGPRGRRGPPGPRGATGPEGPQGPPGPNTLALAYVNESFSGPNGAQSNGRVTCPDGMSVTGGGVNSGGAFNEQLINTSAPSGSNGWVGFVDTYGGTARGFGVTAICTNASVAKVASTIGAAGATPNPKSGGRRGPPGPRGPEGPVGATGPQGPRGPAGSLSSLQLHVVQKESLVLKGTQGGDAVDCPGGEHVIGGGVTVGGTFRRAEINSSGPAGRSGGERGTAWQGIVDAFTQNTGMTITAICTPSIVVEP